MHDAFIIMVINRKTDFIVCDWFSFQLSVRRPHLVQWFNWSELIDGYKWGMILRTLLLGLARWDYRAQNTAYQRVFLLSRRLVPLLCRAHERAVVGDLNKRRIHLTSQHNHKLHNLTDGELFLIVFDDPLIEFHTHKVDNITLILFR